MNKSYTSSVQSFAAGGEVLGRTKDFLKTPDRFRENVGRVDNFEKGAVSSKATKAPAAKGKSLPCPK